jgi:hypothetical protein
VLLVDFIEDVSDMAYDWDGLCVGVCGMVTLLPDEAAGEVDIVMRRLRRSGVASKRVWRCLGSVFDFERDSREV